MNDSKSIGRGARIAHLVHQMRRLGRVRGLAYRSASTWPASLITNAFTLLSYEARHTYASTYRGTRIYKWPTDLWVYQDLVWRLQPDLIIETGTNHGASALFLAHQLDINGRGQVITIDVERHGDPPAHPRITHILDSSIAPNVIREVREAAEHADTVMVILDSDHSERHVTAELDLLADFVTPGSYCIVEDTLVTGHPVEPDYGPGPMEAARKFLARRPDFVVDTDCQAFMLTQNFEGYLKRLA